MFIDRRGIHLGNFDLYFYAVALMGGILAAAVLIAYRAKRHGQDPNHLWDGLVWVVIAGIVGARLYHVLTPPPSMGITPLDYFKNPIDLINTRHGGLGVPGALLCGGLAAFIYARRHKMDFWIWADLIMPGVALGQAVGRIGNYINQELYGKPTDLPWAITIQEDYREKGYEQYSRFHPMFLYEMIWNLLICVGLIWIQRRFAHRLKSGDLLGLYMILYPGGRFFMEFLKLDAPTFGEGPTIAQVVSLVAVVAGLAFLVIRHRQADQQSNADSTP